MACTSRIDLARARVAGELSIDGEAMQRAAFAVTNVTDLWLGAPQRGSDLTIPGRPGVLSMPRRATTRSVTLPMTLDGRFDVDGDPTYDGNELEGMRVLLAWLTANVTGPTYLTDGTRAATLTVPGGPITGSGPVTVEGIEVGQKVRGLWAAVLDLTIPAGALAFA